MGLGIGIQCFVDGLSLAMSRDMRKFVLAPAGLSFILVVSGLVWALSYATDLTTFIGGFLPDWLSFIEWIITPILYLLGLLLGTWTFSLTATIIASPFLGELSKQVELATSGNSISQFVETSLWRQILPALAREMRKLAYHLPRLALLLLLTVIPVINVIAPIAWLGFGAWMMAAQFSDYANENRGHPFGDTLARLRNRRLSALGFGGCTAIAMAIPLLNFFVVPVAVVGGTLLWREIETS
jgi:CysZ protein